MVDYLPIRVRVLSLYAKVEVVLYDIMPSTTQSWILLDYILRDGGIY